MELGKIVECILVCGDWSGSFTGRVTTIFDEGDSFIVESNDFNNGNEEFIINVIDGKFICEI